MTDSSPMFPGEEHTARLRLDCRNYRGERPCSAGIQGPCPSSCARFDAMGHRILIIKLGALGDVVRTTALLPGLKTAWPQSHITWITRPSGVRALANQPLLDRLLPFDAETLCHIEYEQFDLCLGLDKEPGPAALALRVNAADRRGIGLSAHGTPFPLNAECNPYFLLGLDDDFKFRRNAKSYQQLIYEAVGLRYAGQRYRLYPGPAHTLRAAEIWQRHEVTSDQVVIGLNTGAGSVFANKSLSPRQFLALADALAERHAWRIALLGGPQERELNARFAAARPGLIDVGCEHDELTFAALVRRCRVLVTGDTLALHVAIAGDVPCVALFGPTCAQEIDLFGRGEKIVTALPCAPCYHRTCDKVPNCMDDISVAHVLTAIERWATASPAARPLPLVRALPICEVPV